jgi:hypothetical protein
MVLSFFMQERRKVDTTDNVQKRFVTEKKRGGNLRLLKLDLYSLNLDKCTLEMDKYSLMVDAYSLNLDKYSLGTDLYSLCLPQQVRPPLLRHCPCEHCSATLGDWCFWWGQR